MEILKSLIARFHRTGVLLIIGLILIMYIAFGFLYFQQGTQQREFEAQTAKVSAIVAKPFTGGEELQAEYEEVKRALTPMTDADAIAMMVAIAEANGIDASESGGKFRVPPVGRSKATAGGGNYQILSYKLRGDFKEVFH